MLLTVCNCCFFKEVDALQHTKRLHNSERERSTCVTVSSQFHSHKSVQKLFHNLHIIFSKSLMGVKIICQLEKEPSDGTCQCSRNIS